MLNTWLRHGSGVSAVTVHFLPKALLRGNETISHRRHKQSYGRSSSQGNSHE